MVNNNNLTKRIGTVGLAGILALTTGLAAPITAQANEYATKAGVSVKFPLGKDFFKGVQVGISGRYENVDKSEADGVEAGMYFAPLSGNFAPSIEAMGIYTNNQKIGEDAILKAGIGYDFANKTVKLPIEGQYEEGICGTDLLNPLNGAYMGVNSMGAFEEYKANTTTEEALNCTGGQVEVNGACECIAPLTWDGNSCSF